MPGHARALPSFPSRPSSDLLDANELSTAQTAGLNTTAIGNLTTTQVSTLTTVQVAALTTAQIGSLSTTGGPGFSTTHASAITAHRDATRLTPRHPDTSCHTI